MIKVNLNPLKSTTVLPYLGRKISYNKSDWAELYRNLHKYQSIWEMVATVLGKMGAPIKTREMMYKAVV